MKTVHTPARALALLEDWTCRDPSYRLFRVERIAQKGWRSAGWRVIVWSKRRRAPVHPILKIRTMNYKLFVASGPNLYRVALDCVNRYEK